MHWDGKLGAENRNPLQSTQAEPRSCENLLALHDVASQCSLESPWVETVLVCSDL